LRWFYNAIFILGLWLTGPIHLWRIWRQGRAHEGLHQRLGRFEAKAKQAITNRQVIWMHPASGSEIHLCTQLIEAIESRAPNLTIVVSTSTPARMALLKRKLPSSIVRIYSPIDSVIEMVLQPLREKGIHVVET
jgi:3-deoxy-D-manno-octulosonic-acid transferase